MVPIVQDAIFKEPFDDIARFLTADRRYCSIERQSEDYGIVEKGYPRGRRSCATSVEVINTEQIRISFDDADLLKQAHIAGSKTMLQAWERSMPATLMVNDRYLSLPWTPEFGLCMTADKSSMPGLIHVRVQAE